VYVRQRFEQGESVEIRGLLAALIEVDPESVAFTRNATEALQSLIRNYNRLQPGDQVLISDLEYDTVKGAMRWLAAHRGVEVVELSHTHPASFDSLLQTYRDAFAQHPRLKLMALTHVTHRTGLVMPVADIAQAARAHGVDVILDGAHALGQIDFNLAELGIQFAGFNLHKWIGAPLTLGFLYIAPERLADIDTDMGEFHYPTTDVRARTSYSTPNFPALMTLPRVLDEHRALGGAAAIAQGLQPLHHDARRGIVRDVHSGHTGVGHLGGRHPSSDPCHHRTAPPPSLEASLALLQAKKSGTPTKCTAKMPLSTATTIR